MIVLSDFHTKYGVICQADGDMGDSPQRTAMYVIGKKILGEDQTGVAYQAARILVDYRGNLIRDPDKWNDPKDISRDQQDPFVIMLAIEGICKIWMRQMIFTRWKRFGRYPNADVMSPLTLANDFRCLGWWWMWPLIVILDLYAVIGSVVDVVKARLHTKDGKVADGSWLDVDNSITRLSYMKVRYPTPTSWLARNILAWWFPVATQKCGGLISALFNKHRSDNGSNPAMANLWSNILIFTWVFKLKDMKK